MDQYRKEKADLGNQLDEERDKNKGHLRKIEDLEYTKSSLERKIQGLEGDYMKLLLFIVENSSLDFCAFNMMHDAVHFQNLFYKATKVCDKFQVKSVPRYPRSTG